MIEGEEGVLIAYRSEPPAALRARRNFPLPGEKLEGVKEPEILALFEQVLAAEGLSRERMTVSGIPGFALKGEERELFVHPQHLRVRPPEDDNLNRGMATVRVRFELPRGAYASWVVKRLFHESVGERRERRADEAERRGPPDGPARGPDDAPRFERDPRRPWIGPGGGPGGGQGRGPRPGGPGGPGGRERR